jgi:hypothetical protein
MSSRTWQQRIVDILNSIAAMFTQLSCDTQQLTLV